MIRFEEISTKQSGARVSFSFSKRKTKTKYQMNPPPILSQQPTVFANNFAINGLNRFHGGASVAFLGHRHPFRLTLYRRGGPLPWRAKQRSFQNLERHLCPGLFSNDDDVAPDHWPLENIFADGEKVLFGALV